MICYCELDLLFARETLANRCARLFVDCEVAALHVVGIESPCDVERTKWLVGESNCSYFSSRSYFRLVPTGTETVDAYKITVANVIIKFCKKSNGFLDHNV